MATFSIGFLIDIKHSCRKYRKLYIVWLYIFLCFGYMTGSDWRAYELEYSLRDYMVSPSEFGFIFIFDLASRIGLDFWFFSGLMKCLYLFLQIRILKKLTQYTTTCLSVGMITSLLFMLIDYPMRFTAAASFLLLALPYLFERRVLRFVLLSSIGIIFHNTLLITIFICLFCFYIPDKILRINKYALIAIYIAFSLFVSNVSKIAIVQEIGMAYFLGSGMRNYSDYMINNNNVFFTLGSIIDLLLACCVFFLKDHFLNDNYRNKLIFKFAIGVCFSFRVLFVIPVGYRLTSPLSFFTTLILVSLCYQYSRKLLFCLYILYLLTLSKDLYKGFVYIPYSNSIPYILTQDHLPYSERDQYNFSKYKERIGRDFERDD